jgi:hypothetical protein
MSRARTRTKIDAQARKNSRAIIQRRYRKRRKAQQSVYRVVLADDELWPLVHLKYLTEVETEDRARVGEAIAELIKRYQYSYVGSKSS